MTHKTLYRVGLEGNADRGRNRALSMENLYGTADHLGFSTKEDAKRVADALNTAGIKAFVVPPSSSATQAKIAIALGPEDGGV